jgi:GNAT superfamily N-acetyltransferase
VGPVRLVNLGERPDLLPGLRRIVKSVWPPTMEYVHHDAVCDRHWSALVEQFADFQPVLCDRGGRVVAGGYTIPFIWDGRRATLPSGVDGVLVRGVRDRRPGRPPTALSALLAVVHPALQGRGLSRAVIRGMATLAARHGLRALVAPVRPTQKYRYPLISMDRYVRWRRRDGSPFDPWIRVHWRLGARLLGVAPRSMVIDGRVREWEAWTGLGFPESGRYVVPGALAPITIDRRRNRGRYVEANVWMQHPVAGGSPGATRQAR